MCTRKILNEAIDEIFAETDLSDVITNEILKKVCDKFNLNPRAINSDKNTVTLMLNHELESNKLHLALAKDILNFIKDRHNLYVRKAK